MEITELTVKETVEKIKRKEISVRETVQAYLKILMKKITTSGLFYQQTRKKL